VPLLQLEQVTKRHGDLAAVDAVSLDIEPGELFALLGPSGCGKTTLLRLVAGFEAPDAGRIRIDGLDVTDLPAHRRPVNMMFQSYALFPHMNVEKNIGFGLVQDGLPRNEVAARVAEGLRLVQLEGLGRRRPDQLSGGQKQRVALARALVKRPKLLLLDEPLTALDKRLREDTQFELVGLQRSLGTTFVVVTHDQKEAMAMATRIGVMRLGKIEQIGTPAEIYERPASRQVAEFVGEINLLDGEIVGTEGDRHKVATRLGEITIDVKPRHAPGSLVTVAFRPERVALARDGSGGFETNCFRGRVAQKAYLGDLTLYRIATGADVVLRAAQSNAGPSGVSFEPGETIVAAFAPDSCVVLGR
jgi:putrescine transport system ATP-binding protein